MTNAHPTTNISQPDTRFISTEEAARILGVSVATVRRLADRGVLRAYRFVRRLRFLPGEVVAAAEAAERADDAGTTGVCR